MGDTYAMTPEKAERIRTIVHEADAVIISASNGLDMTEGLNLFKPDHHFMDAYSDFARIYGLQSILQGLAARWPSEEERWAFAARFAWTEWLTYEPSPTMRRIRALVTGKPYFVVTCNSNGRFVRAGFDPACVLETEGSARFLMCANAIQGCSSDHAVTDTLMPAEETVRAMHEATYTSEDGRIRVPSELLPHCPHCGDPMVLAIDERRLAHPDPACRKVLQAFDEFVIGAHNKRIAVLELGVGARNQAIKAPLMQLVTREPNASYVTFNYSEVSIPEHIANRSLGVSGDLGAALQQIVPRV